jgi:HK97 family phage major capsid protein
MTQTTAEWRREATEVELRARAAEMRGEWSELSQGNREGDAYTAAKVGFLAEVDDIDMMLTLRQIEGRQYAYREAPSGALGNPAPYEYRTAGDVIAQDEGFRAWCQNQSGRGNLTSESPTVEVRTLVAMATDGGELAPVGQPYLINQDRMRLFIRDLITVQQTTLSAVPFVREKNAGTNATSASTVAEAGLKPEAKVEFTPDLAPVQVIAVNIPITTQILEDAPTVAGYVNGRLSYMLKLREEKEILSGNGLTPDLKGILSYTGEVQTQGATSGDPALTIANAIAKIENVNGYADGVAMSPTSAWAMFSRRATTSGVVDAGTPFASIPLNVWGLPVVRTVQGLTAGHALVGNYKLGATLFDRRQASVRVYEQHSDFVVYNKVLLQGEERVALAVARPDWFVDCTL